MKNERGFATVALLALLPLLLALFALAAIYLIFKNDSEARHICRLELLKAQAEIKIDLRELMALNPEATMLREERRLAEEAYLASFVEGGPGPGTALAQARLTQVVLKQQALAVKQKLIITRARIRSRTAPQRTMTAVREKLRSSKAIQAPDDARDTFKGSTRTAAFDVIAEPPDSLTPDYKPSKNFRDKQEMKVEWSFDATTFLPRWLKNIVGSANVQAKAECSTTLENEENQWEPRITKAKL